MHPNFTIISGGQTGVDTAVLKTAITHRIPYTGFVPRGFTNERGRILDEYITSTYGSLRETESLDTAERTRLNCDEADGLLTLAACDEDAIQKLSRGTELGITVGREGGKDMCFVDLRRYRADKEGEVDKVIKWLDETNVERCAIGGPRESEESGVEREAEEVLGRVWEKVKARGWRNVRVSGGPGRAKVEPFLRDNRWTS
ncbi:hypothetical protein Dda_3633 [Drechslerella dactyloides]|uniref:Uncharacterized protein n=1 Tax=Drechslerella dactyloides TaxID=74499 RepID=A0AAD6J0M1_DREDA|nr:hypothetical protein Dda_3633 [Drechslerella dactyloides]